MSDTTLGNRERVIALYLHTSKTQREIATDLNLSKSAVNRIITRWNSTGSAESGRKGHCGRKEKLTRHAKSLIVREAKKFPTKTAQEIRSSMGSIGSSVCLDTVKKLLRKCGLYAYRPLGIPFLNTNRKKDRHQWAHVHAVYDEDDWSQVSEISFNCHCLPYSHVTSGPNPYCTGHIQ
jgi:transposase